MKIQRRTSMVAAAALLLAVPALVQEAGSAEAASASQHAQSRSVAAAGQDRQSESMLVLPAADLIDRPLRDSAGHDAGQITAIVLDDRNGAVDFVVIGGHGDFNLNGQNIAVPWSVLVPPKGARGPIKLKVSAEKLLKAPRINQNAIASLNQPRSRNAIYGYYGYPYPPRAAGRYGYVGPGYGSYAFAPAGVPSAARPRGTNAVAGGGNEAASGANGVGAVGTNGAGGAVTVGSAGVPAAGAAGVAGSSTPAGVAAQARGGSAQVQGAQNKDQKELVRNGLVVGPKGVVSALRSWTTTSANALQSATVIARNGNTVGRVDQVLLDPEHGEVAFVLLERGGFLGLNPSWFALPIEALVWAPYSGNYALTVNETLLDSEPSVPVNPQHLPTHVPLDQLAQLYRHFGIQPYWQAGGGENGSQDAAGASGSSQPPKGSGTTNPKKQ